MTGRVGSNVWRVLPLVLTPVNNHVVIALLFLSHQFGCCRLLEDFSACIFKVVAFTVAISRMKLDSVALDKRRAVRASIVVKV